MKSSCHCRIARESCYFNGQFIPETEARVSIYDSALNFGDMAFDVTRTFQQRPFRLRDHLGRLFHSLAQMQINPGMTLDELERATTETLAKLAHRSGRCRLEHHA